jgi:DNA-binding transcriptional MerR regulator
MDWLIAEVARMSGVTARTLRHYDEVGLLPPARIGANGHRYYGEHQLLRLQQILGPAARSGLPTRHHRAASGGRAHRPSATDRTQVAGPATGPRSVPASGSRRSTSVGRATACPTPTPRHRRHPNSPATGLNSTGPDAPASSHGRTVPSGPDRLISTLRHGLRQIQYRSNLTDGCLAETGLTLTTRQQHQ